MRHTAITNLLSDPSVSERVVIALAGHIDNQMLDRYSHQRVATKQAAVATLVSDLSFISTRSSGSTTDLPINVTKFRGGVPNIHSTLGWSAPLVSPHTLTRKP